jgi:hypothetical protein
MQSEPPPDPLTPTGLSEPARRLVATMVGENIDRLITIEPRSYGVIRALYAAAREQAGGPLSLAGATLLRDRVPSGSPVLILTGFPILARRLPETDGPPGAAVLARGLIRALDARPLILSEVEHLPPIRAACRAAGLDVIDEPASGAIAVRAFPMDAAARDADHLVDTLRPGAVITIERPGWNRAGVPHNGRGQCLSGLLAPLDHVFAAMRARGRATIGIGDLGNELGMGILRETVERVTAFGARCACPCGAGIAADLPADATVVAGVSNWGAYGLLAALAYLMDGPAVLHTPEMESAVLHACAGAGAIDAATGRSTPWVDGVPLDYHTRLIAQLHDLIRFPARLSPPYRFAYEHNAGLKD